MGDFGIQTVNAIDTLLDKARETFNITSTTAYELAVSKTPMKSGAAISDWKVSVGGGSEITLIDFNNPENNPANASTRWSNTTSHMLGQQFGNIFYDWIRDEPIMQHYTLINRTPYILQLENGTYRGHLYKKGDSFIMPYYWGNHTPFRLTRGGVSYKLRQLHAARGMVKDAARRAARTEYPKLAAIYNK
jgi:hypothetical protein